MEPRAATPAKRLETVRHLAEAGIPTSVMIAPVIPTLNDSEVEVPALDTSRFQAPLATQSQMSLFD